MQTAKKQQQNTVELKLAPVHMSNAGLHRG